MRRFCLLVFAAGFASLWTASSALAEDWPTWRCNIQRSGAASENLPPELHLQWVRHLPRLLLAWPNEPRLHFDACYQPVAVGRTLLLGSPNDGSVTAFDSGSGVRRWQFFSEGPVRFAPTATSERVYFGSDDGWLYCLALQDGRLLWKVRGAPNDRAEQRHLGNNRLISFWPIRGGPVLAGDTVYFGAGLWPSVGVYLVAVDAQSGRLRWRNAELSSLPKVRLDHNVIHPSGLSPQGYPLVDGTTLLVPNGRSMPALLDRATGKLIDYIQGYRNGACQVALSGFYAFVGRDGVVDLRTRREVNSRWAAAGKDAPGPNDIRKAHLFEATLFPYKLFPGCSARSALADGVAYDLHEGTFQARDFAHAALSEYQTKAFGQHLRPWRWDPPLLWQLSTELAPKRPKDSAVIRAGSRLYGHTGGTLIAVDLPASTGTTPRVAWQQPFAGTAAELIAAGGKLFVVTQEGRLACFGSQRGVAKTYPFSPEPLAANHAAHAQVVEIIKTAGVTEGYGLLLGLGPDGLAEQLLLQSRLKLIAVDADAQRVNRLRERLAAANLYGVRAEVFCGQPQEFSLPPYLANLLVARYPSGDAESAGRLLKRWFETLRPYGGTAYLEVPQGTEARALPSDLRLHGGQYRRAGAAAVMRRPGPLPQSAAWTHEYADAALSYFSRDLRVRPPLAILWYGDGPDYGFWTWHDYNTGIKPQVVGGRLVAQRSGELFVYDVYTGRLLWTAKIDRPSRCASMEDGVYLAGVNRCVVYDPATGQPLRSHPFGIELGRPAHATAIRVEGNVIAIASAKHKPGEFGHLWDGTSLTVLDRSTGRILWTRQTQEGYHNHALALGGNMLFCIESPSRLQLKKTDTSAKPTDFAPPSVSTSLALDARTGKTRWSITTANRNYLDAQVNAVGIRPGDDWLGYCRDHGILLTGKATQTSAFDAQTGQPLWHEPIGGWPMMLCGDRFLNQQGQPFDVRTGKRLGPAQLFGKGGCNYAVANPYLLMFRDYSVGFVDLTCGKKEHLFAIRSGCSNSLIAADGLLNVPNFAVGCVCNYPMQTSFALVPCADSRPPAASPGEPRP
jgi:outer membrane protein assembly factor BamB